MIVRTPTDTKDATAVPSRNGTLHTCAESGRLRRRSAYPTVLMEPSLYQYIPSAQSIIVPMYPTPSTVEKPPSHQAASVGASENRPGLQHAGAVSFALKAWDRLIGAHDSIQCHSGYQ